MVRVNLLALAAWSAATAAARRCQNLTIPISITSENQQFNLVPPKSDIEVTNFILDLTRAQNNLVDELFTGRVNVSGSYCIAATYCTPDSGPGKALQILTHGIGFDRSYWDMPACGGREYSYVDAALARGYSTFAYDRLGIGQSSHGDPINEVQAPLQIEALAYLTAGLRTDGLDGALDTAYRQTFHVGHSFGSAQTYAFTARAAHHGVHNVSDGIALTGFSYSTAYLPYFLFGGNFVSATSNPNLASSYTEGYIAAGDASAVQANFFAPDQFDPEVLEASTKGGQPAAIGELLTLAGTFNETSAYQGPVLVVTGDKDIPFCGGNCSPGNPPLPSIPAMIEQRFGNYSDFKAVVIPHAGHGLNLVGWMEIEHRSLRRRLDLGAPPADPLWQEYSHPLTYAAILDFFDEKVSA